MAKFWQANKDFFSLVAPAVVLTLFGVLSIFSSSLSSGGSFDFIKQLLFLFVSLVFAFLVYKIDLRFLKNNSKVVALLYFFSISLLIGLLLFGEKIRGVRGWYNFKFFSFDPEPLAAIVLIIVLAKFFSSRHSELFSLKPIIVSGVYIFAAVFLILLQPDLGSSLSFIFIWLGVLIFSGVRLKHFALLLIVFTAVFYLGWNFWLESYQKQRILSFLDPETDKLGVSWSINQSKIAIGSGGLWGKGIGNGHQTQYGFLSEPKTDFIFSAIGEEFGFVGILFLLLLFAFVFYRFIAIAFSDRANFTRLFSAGLAFFILSNVFVNIGMCLGILPVIGIPLPFVSCGGSHLLGFYLGLGILASLKSRD